MIMSTKALLLQRRSERGSSLSQVTQLTGQGSLACLPLCGVVNTVLRPQFFQTLFAGHHLAVSLSVCLFPPSSAFLSVNPPGVHAMCCVQPRSYGAAENNRDPLLS